MKEKFSRGLIPAFHGHAHGQLCQLDHLANYILSQDLEDLERCEHAFSKSNAMAGALCHAGIFHCHQAINDYSDHNDKFEVYPNLSKLAHYSAMYVYYYYSNLLCYQDYILCYTLTYDSQPRGELSDKNQHWSHPWTASDPHSPTDVAVETEQADISHIVSE